MKFFFADDSQQRCAREGMVNVLGFGGLLVKSSRIRELGGAIEAIIAEFGIPANEEIKWSPRKGSWIYANLLGEARVNCYSKILHAAQSVNAEVIVTVCEPAMRHLKPEWGFERCVMYSLERVSTCLAKAQDEAIIIADRPGGGVKDAEAFLAQHVEQVRSDHNHMAADSFALTLLTAPSKFVRHLQIADLIVSITTAMVAGQTKYAAAYFPIIKEMMLCNILGYAGGTGLKVYPDQLINLYHWVLGEAAYCKAASGMGYGLPAKGHWYFESDGRQQM